MAFSRSRFSVGAMVAQRTRGVNRADQVPRSQASPCELSSRKVLKFVMAGLDPAIHALLCDQEGVDARHKGA
jgi:hypothetical protein